MVGEWGKGTGSARFVMINSIELNIFNRRRPLKFTFGRLQR